MKRTTFLRGIVVVAAGFAATIATAQGYPSRQIQFVIPFAAGGGSDVMARIIAEPLAQRQPSRGRRKEIASVTHFRKSQ